MPRRARAARRRGALGWAGCGARANSRLADGFPETTHMLLPLTSTLLGPDQLGFSLFFSPPLSTALCPGSKVVLKCILCNAAVPVCHYCVMPLNMFISNKNIKNGQKWRLAARLYLAGLRWYLWGTHGFRLTPRGPMSL